jgi:hypothetical protein
MHPEHYHLPHLQDDIAHIHLGESTDHTSTMQLEYLTDTHTNILSTPNDTNMHNANGDTTE